MEKHLYVKLVNRIVYMCVYMKERTAIRIARRTYGQTSPNYREATIILIILMQK